MQRIFLAALGAAVLTGCQTAPLLQAESIPEASTERPSSVAEAPAPPVQGVAVAPTGQQEVRAQQPPPRIVLTPHLLTETAIKADPSDIWDDVYTRIRVTALDLDDQIAAANGALPEAKRKYSEESRNKLMRLLADRSVASNLSLRVVLSGQSPRFEATVPVVAMSQDSSRARGEVWSTEILAQSIDRLVRVRSGTRLSVQAEVMRTKETSPSAVRAALSVARESTKILAPQAGVLTTLSQPSLEREARVWDAALGKLFSFSLAEKVSADTLVSEQRGDARRMTVQLWLPGRLDGYDPDSAIGRWDVRLDCPTPSLFLDMRREKDGDNQVLCKAPVPAKVPLDKASVSRILGYVLFQETSIIDHLRSLRAYAESMQDLAAATDDNLSHPAQRVCGTVLEEMEKLGLTTLDGRLVLWAVSARLDQQRRDAVRQTCAEELMKLDADLKALQAG